MVRRNKIEYLSIAEKDLTDIFDYIYADSPATASVFLDKIDDTVSKLADFPELEKVPNDYRLRRLGYRILIVDNYIVFYVIRGTIVEIRRVLHSKRNYDFLF
jgi:plasmid stabilization system protein ParE